MQTISGQQVQGFGGSVGDLTLEQLYDLIMGQIEPDLVTAQIPLLDAKYANETPEEKRARGERYAEAFALFEQTFGAMTHSWEQAISAYREDAISATAERSAKEDSKLLEDLGGAINDA